MNQPVKTQRRGYRSAVRTEQASSTRQRILETARALFVDRGFAGTTVAAIADSAGISQETIYGTLGGKRGLLEAVIDAVIIPAPEEHQAALEAIERLASGRARLRAYVAFCCGILARTSPVHEVIRGAAGSEAFATELRARLLSERLANQKRHLAQHIRLELRAGINPRQAAERFCALTSPELHHVTITELGWSSKRHEEWIADLVERELLDA